MRSVLQDALRRQTTDGFGGGAGQPFVPQRFQGMSLSKFGINDKAGLSTNAQFGGGGGAGGLDPRARKVRVDGKSMDLADLAFAQMRKGPDGTMRPNYTPISVPYYNFGEDAPGGPGGQKTRPTLHHCDENNSNAAKEIFLNPAGDLQEDNFFLMQLPAVLPELIDSTEEVEREDAGDGTEPVRTLDKLPDGLIGKLKIHKSGKVRMEIGGISFCVDSGATTFFQQELNCVCPVAKEIISLGAIQTRVVITPDVSSLIAHVVDGETQVADEKLLASQEARATAAENLKVSQEKRAAADENPPK